MSQIFTVERLGKPLTTANAFKVEHRSCLTKQNVQFHFLFSLLRYAFSLRQMHNCICVGVDVKK